MICSVLYIVSQCGWEEAHILYIKHPFSYVLLVYKLPILDHYFLILDTIIALQQNSYLLM